MVRPTAAPTAADAGGIAVDASALHGLALPRQNQTRDVQLRALNPEAFSDVITYPINANLGQLAPLHGLCGARDGQREAHRVGLLDQTVALLRCVRQKIRKRVGMVICQCGLRKQKRGVSSEGVSGENQRK